ncbi:hypothetical protein GS4_03_01870 [Gordonia soli NBRC 108243]|uniref:Uncharacterized protein n=1 Tax=Gordonia soli NBRC 108243 TaxID=1223545 RepID=M0QDR3_9ACTN|nr:hypothetical protein GS4_03_01870 [Gordonia soli NBRC 108243]
MTYNYLLRVYPAGPIVGGDRVANSERIRGFDEKEWCTGDLTGRGTGVESMPADG